METYFSASKQRKQLNIVSEISDEIKTLEVRLNNADLWEPNIENKEDKTDEIFYQGVIEKEVKKFY